MSGIYGYYLKGKQNTKSYDKALTFWNSVYGEKTICIAENKELVLSVNLEHLSAKVPEQKGSLNTPSYSAVIDALIYNREELSKSYSFDLNSLSDEELIFKIITENGIKDLSRINGDFAGVLYNKKSETFTLFRDHMGVRPLFYYMTDDCFVFSTDMRAFLAIPELNISINDNYLYLSLVDQLVTDDNDFIFKEIHVVRYASWCTITENTDGLHISQPTAYWKLGQQKVRLKDRHAYQIELRRLVEEAIKHRADAIDGPIGAELSGGVDSSVISILLHRLGREDRYFSWSYPPEVRPITQENDERNIISALCKQEGISVRYNTDDLDAPADNSFIHIVPPNSGTLIISNACNWFHSQGVKAVFTGHGGDEGVSHRARTYELLYHKDYPAYFSALYNIRKKDGHKLPLLRSIRAFARDLITPYKGSVLDNDAVVLKEFLNSSFYHRIHDTCKVIPYTFGYDVVEYLQHGFHTGRPFDTAYQGAAFGVRYLFPYLDYNVMDFAVSIPRRLYTNGIQNRMIYMDAFKDILPEELLKYRSKDTPSTQPPVLQGDALKQKIDWVNSEFHWYVSKLDPARFAPYLDLEKMNNYNIPEDISFKELRNCAYKNICLFYCVKLQHAWDHAIDPVLSDGKKESKPEENKSEENKLEEKAQ